MSRDPITSDLGLYGKGQAWVSYCPSKCSWVQTADETTRVADRGRERKLFSRPAEWHVRDDADLPALGTSVLSPSLKSAPTSLQGGCVLAHPFPGGYVVVTVQLAFITSWRPGPVFAPKEVVPTISSRYACEPNKYAGLGIKCDAMGPCHWPHLPGAYGWWTSMKGSVHPPLRGGDLWSCSK